MWFLTKLPQFLPCISTVITMQLWHNLNFYIKIDKFYWDDKVLYFYSWNLITECREDGMAAGAGPAPEPRPPCLPSWRGRWRLPPPCPPPSSTASPPWPGTSGTGRSPGPPSYRPECSTRSSGTWRMKAKVMQGKTILWIKRLLMGKGYLKGPLGSLPLPSSSLTLSLSFTIYLQSNNIDFYEKIWYG